MSSVTGLFQGVVTGGWSRQVAFLLLSLLAALACLGAFSHPASAALRNLPDQTDATEGTVRAILRVGDTIYLGGEFQEFGGTTRYNIAAIDANTGRLEDWNPRINCCVKTLAASADGNTIYAGGSFTMAGGSPHSRIAAIDAATGQVSDVWSPDVGPAGSSAVNSIAVQGDRVYFGGTFSSVDGRARRNLAMVSGANGAPSTGWHPAANGTVFKLKAVGTRLYVGGSFRTVGGAARRNLAALSTGAGRATSWRPNPGRPILDLAVSGKRVYTAQGGKRGGSAVAYGISSGHRRWALHADGDAQTVAVMDRRVFVGGHFARIDGKRSYGLAAVIPGKGRIDPRFRARPDRDVWTLVPDASHGRLYLGGAFSSVSGVAQSGFAQISRA